MAVSSDVIGGIGKPKFFILNEELVDDFCLELPISVSWLNSSFLSRILVQDSPFSTKALKFVSLTNTEISYFKLFSISSEDRERSYFVSFMLKTIFIEGSGSTRFDIVIKNGSNFSSLIGGWKSLAEYVNNPELIYQTFYLGTEEGSEAYFAIAGDTDNPFADELEATIYFISCREIVKSFSFQEENKIKFIGEKEFRRKTNLESSLFFEEVLGWRTKLSLSYDYLTAEEEVLRNEIAEAKSIALFPRDDSKFFTLCKWSGDFRTSYVEGKMIGHTGDIQLEAIFLVTKKQTDIVL